MINKVICPNCICVTPPLRYCMICNAYIGDLLDRASINAADKGLCNARLLTIIKNFLLLLCGAISRPFARRAEKRRARKVARRDTHLAREYLRRLAAPSINQDEIAIIARVSDRDAFEALENVKVISYIEPNALDGRGDNTTMVTARIAADPSTIERVVGSPSIVGLKTASRMRPFLERTKRAVFGDLGVRSDEPHAGGSGVIIGIVDFGIDFAHKNFQNPDGTSRILAIWDQTATVEHAITKQPVKYGRLILKDEIDNALKAHDPYQALAYGPSSDSLYDTGAHGTYVTDVAAGSGVGSNCSGIAPDADIVFVDLSTASTQLRGVRPVGSTFGDSVQLLEAIEFIFDFAEDRPCVINISLGTNGGPHDGSTPLEQAIDNLVSARPNRAVVIAAGNSYGDAIHVEGSLSEDGTAEIGWNIPQFDSTCNEVELWYPRENRFDLEIFDPRGIRVLKVKAGEVGQSDSHNQGLIVAVSRIADSGDNTINVFFEYGVRHGVWTLKLQGDSFKDKHFHAWIERDEHGHSHFVEIRKLSINLSAQITDRYTLGSIACGRKSIAVGSYDANDAEQSLSEFSSSGPTRDERRRPEITAPGEHIFAALSGTTVLRNRQSGTSLAAAVVTGTVALMLAEAQRLHVSLTVDQIRYILVSTAQIDPPARGVWDPRYGYGRVCATAALRAVRELATNVSQTGQLAQPFLSKGREQIDVTSSG